MILTTIVGNVRKKMNQVRTRILLKMKLMRERILTKKRILMRERIRKARKIESKMTFKLKIQK